MLKAPHILVLACIFSHLASAGTIYKCTGKDGTDLYQNFPCSIDSIGWKPKDAPVQNAQTAASAKVSEPTKATPTSDVGPRVGMNAEEVRTIWGEPTGDAIHGLVPILHTEIGGRSIEIWTYGTTQSVQFDQNGRVSIIRP
ncbi:MAG TPA: DUF4124 domain-containing protein [Blastocatellia bacterium]